jgi:transcription elongation factor Elf1
MKGYMGGGSGKKKSGKEKEKKTKKLFRGQFRCPNCGVLKQRKGTTLVTTLITY